MPSQSSRTSTASLVLRPSLTIQHGPLPSIDTKGANPASTFTPQKTPTESGRPIVCRDTLASTPTGTDPASVRRTSHGKRRYLWSAWAPLGGGWGDWSGRRTRRHGRHGWVGRRWQAETGARCVLDGTGGRACGVSCWTTIAHASKEGLCAIADQTRRVEHALSRCRLCVAERRRSVPAQPAASS